MDILKIFTESDIIEEMSDYTPTVRGGWNKAKIIKYLKQLPSKSSDYSFYKTLTSYSTFEEFKSHLYWHGSSYYSGSGLKPSITFHKNWGEDGSGGGGYGVKYWTVSVSKSKKVASAFSGDKRSVSVYPVLISKDATIIEMLTIKDSEELEEHIEDLWNRGIDAVYIGGGELELCILNPSCCVIGKGDYYEVFGISVKDPTDEELMVIWNNRNRGIEDAELERKKRVDAKKALKQKKEEDFIEAEKKFLSAVEDYKVDNNKSYSLKIAYDNLENKSIQVFKVMTPYKNILRDVLTDMDKLYIGIRL